MDYPKVELLGNILTKPCYNLVVNGVERFDGLGCQDHFISRYLVSCV